jgi:hypothetical protein
MSTLLMLLAGLAHGQDKVEFEAIETSAGHLMFTSVTDFPVDAEGNRYGEGPLYHLRSRPGFTVGNSQVSFGTQWDIFTGHFADGTWEVPGTADARDRHLSGVFHARNFKPRRLSVKANLPGAEIEAGLVTSHWGLGMLANDGDHQPWFGETDFGDRVIRMRVSTAPGPDSGLSITAAYDRVVEDDLARWSDGQWASQVLGALVYRDEADRTLGLYGVIRKQEEWTNERLTHAKIIDIYARSPVPLVGNQKLVLSLEVAGIDGRTNRATTYNSTESIQIRSGGATALVSYGTLDDRLTAHLSSGWASGDGDPDDNVSNDFRFDRDFGVGQVLFDEVLGAIDAAAFHTLSDPQYAGQPPDGLDATVSEGAFQTATFLQPVLEARPLTWLHLRGGGAVSWSTKPIGQRFYTHRAGGTPHNQHNQPTDGYHLGTELDWSLVLDGTSKKLGQLIFSGGHLFLGESLKGAGPDRIDLYRAMIRFQ